jgi:hypothetical protein
MIAQNIFVILSMAKNSWYSIFSGLDTPIIHSRTLYIVSNIHFRAKLIYIYVKNKSECYKFNHHMRRKMKTNYISTSANPPEPTYGTAIVDGVYNEWNLTNDFFANMYNGGNNNGKFELASKAYIRYDASTSTVYLLVLSDTMGPTDAPTGIPTITSSSDAWVALSTINSKAIFTNFAWVGVNYDNNPNHARGYEASFQLPYPGTYSIAIHSKVLFKNLDSTSATFGNGLFIPLVLNPPEVTEHPSISITKSTNGTDGASILVMETVTWTYLVTNTGDGTPGQILINNLQPISSLID